MTLIAGTLGQDVLIGADDADTLSGVVEEIDDVAVIPNVQVPMALGFKTAKIQKILSIAP